MTWRNGKLMDIYGNALRAISDGIPSTYEIGLAGRALFRSERRTVQHQAAFDNPKPLVSVCIATCNRGPLLTERSLKSVLAQNCNNLEPLVLSDCCADDTAERILIDVAVNPAS